MVRKRQRHGTGVKREAALSVRKNGDSPARREVKVSAWFIVAFSCFYFATTTAHVHIGDEDFYINLAETFVHFGKLQIAYVAPDMQLFEYSKYPLGQSIVEVPAAAVRAVLPNNMFSHVVRNVVPALECALIVAVLYWLVRMPGPGGALLSRRSAAALVMLSGVATYLWPAASTHFADTSAACVLFVAIAMVAAFHRMRAGAWTLGVAGVAAAFAFQCKNTYALAWPGLVAFSAWAVWQRVRGGERLGSRRIARIAAIMLIPLLASVALQLWYNHYRFDSIWLSGYHEGRDAKKGFDTPLHVGLYGLFFSSGRSIFLYSPPCVMALIGCWKFFRMRSFEALLVGAIAVPLTISYAMWWSWNGGWEWGTRMIFYLVPILMWLSTPAWQWLDRPRNRPFYWRAGFTTLLVVVGIAVQIIGLLIRPTAAWDVQFSALPDQVTWKSAEEEELVRGQMPLGLFEPRFSPIGMNVWLIWATWNRDRMTDAQLAEAAPMRRLDPVWTPTKVKPFTGWDLWAIQAWNKPATPVVFISLMMFCAFAAFRVLQLTRSEHA